MKPPHTKQNSPPSPHPHHHNNKKQPNNKQQQQQTKNNHKKTNKQRTKNNLVILKVVRSRLVQEDVEVVLRGFARRPCHRVLQCHVLGRVVRGQEVVTSQPCHLGGHFLHLAVHQQEGRGRCNQSNTPSGQGGLVEHRVTDPLSNSVTESAVPLTDPNPVPIAQSNANNC